LRTAGDRPIDISHIRLVLNVDLPKKTVDASAYIDFRTTRAQNGFALDAVGFEIKGVTLIQGKPVQVSYRHDGQHLMIDFPERWAENEKGHLVVDYRVREPKDGLYFFGPTKAEPEVPWMLWSQGEPVANRYWIPCLDHPDQKQTTEMIVTVAEGYEVLSNGKLVKKTANGDKTVTFHWKQDTPHVSYLITLVVGQFDIVREDWKGREVSYYVPKGKAKDIQRTFGRTRKMIDFFSKRFGIDYPWDKYSQVVVEQFTAGGMENTSATTLHEYAIHDARSMIDSDPDGLISHELGHQWWGDLVTCRDWSHLWLNEGFASYCEVLWDEHHKGPDEAAYNLIHKARGALDGAKDRPVMDRRYPHPMNMFDARSYPKGAWLLNMLRKKLGDDDFFKALQLYGTEHRYKTAETGDFRRTLEKVTGQNLERFFYDWAERAGNPTLEIHVGYAPESKMERIIVKQTQPGEAFQFDLPVRWQANGSTSSSWQEETLPVREKEQTFYLKTGQPPSQLEIDPNQTVLADYQIHQGRELWLPLLHSPSVAMRVQAAVHFGKSKEPADRELLAKALKEEPFYGVGVEIANALGDSGGDTSRDALIDGLKLPQPKVRRACADALGKFPNDEKVAAALKALLKKGDESYFVEAAAVAAYAKLRQSETVAVLLPWLAKASYQEVIRSAVLKGFGESEDLSSLDTLLSWTKKGKPTPSRIAALQGLAALNKNANPDDAQRKQMADAIGACLENEGPRVRRAAVEAIRELGRSATPSATVLEMIARHDDDPRLAELAKKAAEQVRSQTAAPLELKRLREELEALKKDRDTLKQRLEKMEKK
jgi:aminopeptidase N